MKQTILKKSIACTSIVGTLLLFSCEKPAETSSASTNTEANPSSKSAAKPSPAPRADLPVKELEVTGNDEMKFDVEELEAQARQSIELTFKNVGTMPKQSMGHNWCLLVKDANSQEFLEAGFASASNGYVASDDEDQVIARTKILGPGEAETITFTAPESPGSYEYICTFPGHYMAGMKGILEITQ
jgi:azurin